MNDQLQAYVTILQLAYVLGQDLVDLIKDHASKTLTPEEYVALEAAFNQDAVRAKHNAGLDG